MSPLAITPRHLDAIRRHAAATYPEECCGVLIGQENDEGPTRVERVLPARNERAENRARRYVIAPQTVLAAHKEARALGLDVIGYYHSHPDHPAVPSDFDRQHAWPNLSYLIVAVAGGRADELRSWRLADDRQRFDEQTIEPMRDGPKRRPRRPKEALG